MRAGLLAAALLAGLSASPARAASVIAVLSADHGAYHEALEGLQSALGSTVTVRLASGRISLDPDTKVVVAIGGRAALSSFPKGVPVVYCLAPAIDLDASQSIRVRLVPPADALLARIKAVQPRVRTVAVIWAGAAYRRYVDALAATAKRTGLTVLSTPVDSDADLPRALHLLGRRADALWLAPDPALVTPDNFRLISSYARGVRAVFYAPSADLVSSGATAAIDVTPREMGRAAAAVTRRMLAGSDPPADVYAETVETVVDPARASEAGLILSTDVVKLPR